MCFCTRWTKGGITCLTCGESEEKCQYNSAYFSHDASFYRMSCSGQSGVTFHVTVTTTWSNIIPSFHTQVLVYLTILSWTTQRIRVSHSSYRWICCCTQENKMTCIYWSLELKRLEDNSQFSNMTADIRLPTVRRGTIRVAGYSK